MLRFGHFSSPEPKAQKVSLQYSDGVPSVRPSSSNVATFEYQFLRGQMANLDQFVCVASLGQAKGCIRFKGRSDKKNLVSMKIEISHRLEMENIVWMIVPLFLVGSLSNMQVMRSTISRTPSISNQELIALERQYFFPCVQALMYNG